MHPYCMTIKETVALTSEIFRPQELWFLQDWQAISSNHEKQQLVNVGSELIQIFFPVICTQLPATYLCTGGFLFWISSSDDYDKCNKWSSSSYCQVIGLAYTSRFYAIFKYLFKFVVPSNLVLSETDFYSLQYFSLYRSLSLMALLYRCCLSQQPVQMF